MNKSTMSFFLGGGGSTNKVKFVDSWITQKGKKKEEQVKITQSHVTHALLNMYSFTHIIILAMFIMAS